jgi:hypothetical protein
MLLQIIIVQNYWLKESIFVSNSNTLLQEATNKNSDHKFFKIAESAEMLSIPINKGYG